MTDFVQARDKWASMSVDERRAWIRQVHGDETAAEHDWAGLPPQAHAVLIASMQPQEAAAENESSEAEEEPHGRGRRKRSDD